MKRFKTTITWLLENTRKMKSEKVQEVYEELLAQEVQVQEVLYLSTNSAVRYTIATQLLKLLFST